MAAFTAAEAIEMAMEIELNGKQFYLAAAQKSIDPDVKALFEDLANQEQGHYHVFQGMLGGVQTAPEQVAEEYDQYQTYMKVALENALFAGPDKALALAEDAEERETALRAAIGFEKDTLLFFYDVRDMVNEADRETISKIIREEKKHLRQLTNLL
ncbi:MAG TPA: rubrerythrin [Chloroflexi bacterium]|nr:rubrerythrin [Chloroflexota bacterium]